ncbi:MAG: ribokinase [Chloroflexi bacterium]|nr:MAG: ribokinase [Chloroflexota bacterium]
MFKQTPLKKVDYLVIGHFAKDLTPDGYHLGGTAAYAALTARALGLRVGILSSFNEKELSLEALAGIPIVNIPAEETTTFSNLETNAGRAQILHQRAAQIDFAQVPEVWRRATIIHLAPIAQEMKSQLPAGFSPALLGLTPQGWLRGWDDEGRISLREWSEMEASLKRASAAVLSVEDVQDDEELIEEISLASRVLALTEGDEGARLYWNRDLRRFSAPVKEVLDTTGAGDIFAAAFFIRLHSTRDPWEAARFATCLASQSVTRRGLTSIPTEDEIQTCQMEVL